MITRYRHTNQNLQTNLRHIPHKAGITPWPKLYQNLRSTRQKELADEGPMHKICSWFGNSPAVALKHYLQKPTDDDYRKAAQCPSESAMVQWRMWHARPRAWEWPISGTAGGGCATI